MRKTHTYQHIETLFFNQERKEHTLSPYRGSFFFFFVNCTRKRTNISANVFNGGVFLFQILHNSEHQLDIYNAQKQLS